jgi:hypothetical protein
MNQILENSNPHIDILSMMQNLHLTTRIKKLFECEISNNSGVFQKKMLWGSSRGCWKALYYKKKLIFIMVIINNTIKSAGILFLYIRFKIVGT